MTNPMMGMMGRDRPVAKAAYFFLCGFAFFFTICAWVFGGIAIIRRASSSSDMGWSCGFFCCAGIGEV